MHRIDTDLLRRHVADGTVSRREHPTLPLAIYSYTPRCQYDRLWDDVSRRARGLVLCGDTVVARPLPKFFNDTEHPPGEVPWHLPCEITEKLDGSLLIAFHFDGEWHFATRGSFTSSQAKGGRDVFFKKYVGTTLDPAVTYLFEFLHPTNRIVVDYGATEDVVLLAMIEIESGRERPLADAPPGLRVVRRLPPDADAKSLRTIIRDNEEGYVVRFDNGFRVKIKGERYVQLHRLITGVSSRTVWEYLSQNKSFDDMLAITPDEFSAWVAKETAAQRAAFDALRLETEWAHAAVRDLPTRKEQAIRVLADHKDVSAGVFALLDGKPLDPLIWKRLYPEFRRPEVAERLDG